MLKDQLMESFENIYDDYLWLTHIFQDTFNITYKRTNILIQNKVKLILEVLNLKDNSSENFLNRFRSLFQDYFQAIFLFNEEFFSDVKSEIIKNAEKYKECSRLDDIKSDINSRYFKILINTLFKLSIYMLLHDPLINLSINEYEERKIEYYFFNKSSFLSVEGFGKEKTPCSIILSPPTFKNNFIFQGIKPAVYCLANVSQEVIKECEEKEFLKMNLKEKSNYEEKDGEVSPIQDKNNKSLKTSNIQSQSNSIIVDEDNHIVSILNNNQSEISNNLDFIEKTDCFDHPLKRDSLNNNPNNKNHESYTIAVNYQTTELKNQTIANSANEKEYVITESNKKRTNYRSNSELMKNENSMNVGDQDINLINNSYLSTENNKIDKQNIKALDKLLLTSNFDNHHLIENSTDITVLIKKKNLNFANNFLDSYNKTNVSNFKQSLQHKVKHNSTNSSSLKINTKMQKNNYFQTNRERSSFNNNKQTILSQESQKRKDPNKIFEKNRGQNNLHSPELSSGNSNYSKISNVFISKDQAKENFFTKGSEKNNSPKILNNFMKMKSVITMKNSIKNAYIEYINSKAQNKNLNINVNKKHNLNSSNPNSNNNNNVIYNIKSNFNRNSLNFNVPQTGYNRNDKNLLSKNLTDKTNSRPENNLNDNEYVQLNSENIVDCSNRNLYELCSKTPIDNTTFQENNRTSELRYSAKFKREKDVFYSTNHNNSKRDSLKDNNNISSNNSTNENFNKKDKLKVSPKSDIKPNQFFSKEHYSSAHRETKNKLFEPSKTSKQLMFKNLQKNFKNSNKIII